MNLKTFLLHFAILAASAGVVRAQPPEEPSRRHPERPRPERRGPEASPAPVERYLNHLRQSNPEDFQRLTELREQDPEAFRRELRRKAYAKREKASSRPGRPHPLKEEIAALRAAETESDRDSAIQAIRAKIIERVDRNLEEREKVIQDIRTKLRRLEEQHEQEQARREEIIAHHLDRILNHAEKPHEQGNDTP